MLAIRIIIEVIIFIYMMSLSIRIRKQKIKKTRRIKMIRVFLTIMFVIVVPYLSYVPIENYFITFKSPEKAMAYEEWLMPKREIDDIIDGKDSCMVIEKRKKNGMISYETEYLRKVQGGYKFLGTLDVEAENITGTAIIVWHIKGTED